MSGFYEAFAASAGICPDFVSGFPPVQFVRILCIRPQKNTNFAPQGPVCALERTGMHGFYLCSFSERGPDSVCKKVRSGSRYSITSRTAMTPPSLLRDDPWAESHDLCCFGKLGSKAEGGYPSQTVGSVIGGATEMSFK